MAIRPMRRRDRQMTTEEALSLLKKSTFGVLATVNKDNEPRAVAVNHVLLDEQTLIFHGANAGEKYDNMKRNHAISYFVVAHETVKGTEFTTDFASVSVQGHVDILEKENAYPYLVQLSKHFAPELTNEVIHDYTYPAFISKVALFLVHIDDIKGKIKPNPGYRER